MNLFDIYESPLGPLTLVGGPACLSGLWFPERTGPMDGRDRDPGALSPVTAQLDEYFAGERRAFDVKLDLHGTAFQQRVWEALRQIPYGSTIAYGELARRVGRPDSVRAVAAAVGRTPVPIIVPCHRVVGADGSLTGYGGGLPRKRALLALEGQLALV
jgi:methylated-DNA-[protein]-cysteine S-methyltransferase